MADNETPSIVPDLTEQQQTETPQAEAPTEQDVSDSMPENMPNPEEILSPQAPLSEVLTSLKD